MKKITLLLLICFIIIPNVFANDGPGFSNRGFEFGFNANLGFSNNFVAATEIFKEIAVIDFDILQKNGFVLNLGFGATPLYFNINVKNNWGFGLSLGVDLNGVLSIPGSLFSLSQVENERINISGAAYAAAQFSTFFHVSSIKMKVSPSMYMPIAIIVPDSYYTFNTSGGVLLDVNFDLKVFAPFNINNLLDSLNGSGSFTIPQFADLPKGFDFDFGFEYPLFKGFKVGLDIYNFPLISAKMEKYLEILAEIKIDRTYEELFSGGSDEDLLYSNITQQFVEGGGLKYGAYRPMKTHLYAQWMPLGRFLTLTPIIGFSLAPYSENGKFSFGNFSLECGANVKIDLLNFLILQFGVGYYDNFWKNSLDLALNLKIIELNVGVDLRSASFAQSWKGAGLGVNIGLKFGL